MLKSVHTGRCSNIHKQYKKKNPGDVGRSKSASFRPSNVKPVRHKKLLQCLCPYCTNIELKLKKLNAFLTVRNKVESKYEASSRTMCTKAPDDEFHKRKCINRSCSQCGTALLKKDVHIHGGTAKRTQQALHMLEGTSSQVQVNHTFQLDFQGAFRQNDLLRRSTVFTEDEQ